MANRVSDKMVKAFEKFNADLETFRKQTEGEESTLYEDAYTTRKVKDFRLCKNGKLTWVEDGHQESEQMFDDDEAKEYLSFWRANLRRAKRYWEMDTETLDKIQEGEVEDTEE
jgi:hypothetical protein